MALYFNISGALTKELIAAGSGDKVSSIQLVNTHATDAATVDLYIEKKITGSFYLMKSALIPIGATLVHDNLAFSTTADQFGLYIKLGAASSVVDVIIN